ncbi:MAG: Ig-like domain-containing protein [Anaerolineales bacterium]
MVQEIVTRPGWAGGNSLAIIITGTGLRTAESFNGDQAGAPLLHVEYIASGNNNPGVTINLPAEGSTFNEDNSITFSGMAGDVEDGDLTASLVWESSIDGPIGSGGSFLRSDLSVGAHTITARVTDSGGQVGVDTIQITIFADTNILVGAGDIAYCNSLGDEQTAALLDDVPGTVFTLGDNAYEDGTEAEFNDCYDPTWGRHKARTRPAPGNHDYHTLGASGYFNYFGTSAGEAGKGYYSYEVGDWHVIVLNSDCSEVGGCDRSSPQGQWLQADLAANPRACTLAYWHSPLFSSDSLHGNNTSVQDFWSLLYESGADVVLNGHAHTYERFAPQDPNGAADSDHGIREFVVGTGGKSLFTFGPIQRNSEVRYSDTYGVLKLSLQPGSYGWEFIPVNGGTFTDSGSAACVGIASGNTAPLAADDTYTTDEDTLLTVAAPGVLGNDTDAENDPLTTVLNTGPGNGTLTLNADGSFSYTPNPDFNGSDSFTYHANDGLVDSNLATVSITVTPVNDPPKANVNGPYTGTVGIAVQFDGSASSDVDGTIVSYDWDFGDGTSGTGPNPTHTYAETGTYTVVLTVTDDGGAADSGTTSANIQSTPNQAPVAGDDAYATDEDTILTVAAPGVLGNDTDADGDSLTAALVSDVSNGTLSLNADGSFTYAPNADFNGADGFTYTADDGRVASNIATVSITINAINDPPVAVDDAYTTEQGTRLDVAPAGVLANDGDVDGDGLSAALVSGVSNGTLTLNEDGSFSYTPEAGFTGTDGFTYIANDGVLDSNAATVTIMVNPSAPVTFEVRVAASSDDAEENTSGRVSLTSSDLELVLEKTIQVVGLRFNGVLIPPGATINNATLQFQADETNSQAADLIIRAQAADNPATFVGGTSGDVSSRPTTSAAVSWAPPPWNTKNEQGPDQRSTDFAPVIQEIVNRPGWTSGNSVVIIITGSGKRVADSYNGSQAGAPLLHVEYTTGLPNNPPVANVDSASTPEDTTVMVDVVANDTDPDGNLASATANTACATCADPSAGTLVHNGDGTFDYTPNANFNGTDGFVYEICDALGACDTASVSITVTPVNDPPVAHDDSASTQLDTPVTVDVAGNDTDVERNLDPGSVTVSNAPNNGTTASSPDGTITYTPDAAFNGNDSFTYRICDTGGLCDTAFVAITVNPSAPATFEVRVAAGSDDAEENTSGRVSLTSSDLELVLESSIQTVGMRFNAVAIPPGATITNATLQFQADETNSEATDLIIRAQAADNPATFIGGSGGDISGRPTTSAAASWAPPPWNTKNEQGPDQRSTDFAPVIQEIVNRPGWSSGNSVVIIITGSGKRVADSYDGSQAGAPLLHVEYFSP